MEKENTLNEVFKSVVAQYPHNKAIVSDTDELTYQQLDERASALSQHISAHGVVEGSIVAINLSSSLESVISMVALAKLGAAYVVVPVDYPKQRQHYLIEDSGAQWVLSEQTDLQSTNVRCITFQDSQLPLRTEETTTICVHDIAYLIYTSGSMGNPKGVAIAHQGITNLVSADQQYIQFCANKTVLQFAPLTFDAAAFEIWGALLNGAKLVLTPSSYERIGRLSDYLDKYKVDILLLTPALFNSIVDHNIAMLSQLAQLIVGGDAMSVTHARKYIQYKEQIGMPFLFHNVYGPTEGTTLVSYFNMRELESSAHRAPLGKSIVGLSIYLLDEDHKPVGENQTGEIYIAGKGVTLGYVNQPSLTSLRYLPDPFCEQANAVMYATGDLGRQLANGHIEFIGRQDAQVKIRGHRIELSEIEIQLSAIAGIESVYVTYHKDETTANENLLCHYLLKEEATAISPDILLAQSKQLLPDYMVPSFFIPHTELPLTGNGKIDKKRLVEEWADARADIQHVAVSADLTATEQLIAPLWQSLLHLETLTKKTDFFLNGGDSLLAVQLIAELEKSGIQASIEDLFHHPIFGEFCNTVTVLNGQSDESEFAKLQRSLWSSILGVDTVHSDDDFFLIGGNSILAIQLIADSEKQGFNIELESLFHYPVFKEFCARFDWSSKPVTQTTVALGPNPFELLDSKDKARLPENMDDAYPASQLQLGMLYESLMSDEVVYLDIVSRIIGMRLELDTLKQSLGFMTQRHPILRTKFDFSGYSVPLQLVGAYVEIPFSYIDGIDLDAKQLAQVQKSCEQTLSEPFDAEIAPLIRVAVIVREDSFYLYVAFHHAILDGWSESIFFSELIHVYLALLNNEKPDLPQPAPFSEFIRLESEARKNQDSADMFKRFTRQTAPLATSSALFVKQTLNVNEARIQALESVSRTYQVPLKSVLFASFYQAIAQILNDEAPVVGMSFNSRPEIDGSQLTLGLFLNHLPIQLSGCEGWEERLKVAFDSEKALIPHRRFPYSEIQKITQGRPFDASFSYVHFNRINQLYTDQVILEEKTIDQTSLPIRVEYINEIEIGQFQVDITVNERCFQSGTCEQLVTAIETCIYEIIQLI